MNNSSRLLSMMATVTAVGSLFGLAPANAAVASSAFYVSPSGADTNAGTTYAKPFKTLEKAQAAMEKSTVKVTYLEGGTYTRTVPLKLQAADGGESWLAYPGQNPVLDGGRTTEVAIYVNANSNVTIRWLTIQNFSMMGIWTTNATNTLIDSNTITNIFATAWSQGGIVVNWNAANTKVTHNLIRNSQYDGILAAAPAGDNMNNLTISYNAVYNTCTLVADCGAIHADDRSGSSTGIVISNNVVGQYGSAATRSNGIYLDDLLSNATVTNNIVYGTGWDGVMIHAGSNDVIKNNIFDITYTQMLGYYSQVQWPNAAMTGNVFTCNVIYSSGSAPISLWSILGAGAKLTDTKNLYWKTSGAMPNIVPIVDTAPTKANPGFVNPSAGNYAMTGNAPPSCAFQPIVTTTVGPLPNT